MTIEEVGNLLAKAAVYDNRVVEYSTVLAWHEAIGHLDYTEAMMALGAHVRESREYLQPSHIVALVKASHAAEYREEQRKPLPSTKGAPKPDNFDAMVAAYRDPQAFSVEVAKYDRQLIAAGYEPTHVSVGMGEHGVTIHGRVPVAASASHA